ncbi:MAG TPA: BatD family protein [Chitinophagaceae bacterium]|jgi:hypothetical protein|nr:BatD family protein [Chitinophagaceae bacterium]
MRWRISILSIFIYLFFLPAFSQVSFKTVVPHKPIAPGESFQVQYVLENAKEINDFSPPSFPNFKIVAGPNVYSGKKFIANNESVDYKNLVFTLAAVGEGKFKIHGATCVVDGKFIKSNDVIVEVIFPKELDESPYFLKPGEDPFKKISENLFLKLIIDKQTCFIGEPLVATFKLYSRLQSRANVIKNPGFYGFSVYDMINVNDKIRSEEKLNGYWFDVHTVRKVQLYPLQAGTFIIDAMELANQVELSRSAVNKKTEQEVSENMYGNNEIENVRKANVEVYDMNVKTKPVIIKVKPLPSKNEADTFAGAVGNFTINAFLEKDSLLRNEETSLIVEIKGAGNFQRVNAPVINWPQTIEAFEPSLTDTFNKQQVPLTGQRSFKYVFLSGRPGQHTIPSISFSFFNLKTKTYKTVSTKPLSVFVNSQGKEHNSLKSQVTAGTVKNKSTWALWLYAAGALVLIAGAFVWLQNKLHIIRKIQEQKEIENISKPRTSIEEILMPAQLALSSENNFFYKELNQQMWNYFYDRFQLSGIQMNKNVLQTVLITKGIESNLVERLIDIIRQCEAGIYTKAEINLDKMKLFQNAQQILTTIENSLTGEKGVS